MRLAKTSKYPYVFINSQDELDPLLINAIDTETSFMVQNVDFIMRQRAMNAMKMGKKLEPWDGKIHFLRKSKNGTYYFPIGLLSKVEKIFTWFGTDYDENLQFSSSDTTVNIDWTGPELYTHQIDAFVESLTKERCVVCLPTGSGKTLTGIRIIAELKKPSLILVHRKELAKQWKDAFEQNTNISPVIFDDKKKKFGEITVAMVGSIFNYTKTHALPIFDVLLADECFPYDTLITTNIGELPIGLIVEERLEVNVLTHTGEWKPITNYYSKCIDSPVLKITHDFGSIICTDNHKILTQRGWIPAKYLSCWDIMYNYSNDKDIHMPVLWQGFKKSIFGWTTRLLSSYKSIGTKRENKKTVVESLNGKTNRNYTECYREEIKAPIWVSINTGAGTNHIGKSTRGYVNYISKQRKQISENNSETLFRPTRVCNVEILPVTESCNNATKSKEKWRVWRICNGFQHAITSMFNFNSRFGEKMWKAMCNPRLAEFNHTSNSTCGVVSRRWFHNKNIQQNENKDIRTHNFNFHGVEDARTDNDDSAVVKKQMGDSYFNIFLGKGERITYTQKTRSREIYQFNKTICGVRNNEIQDKQFVYDLEVKDNHSYVANGIVVHNCHHVAARTIYDASLKCDARYRFGLSATPQRSDGMDMYIEAALGPYSINVRAEDLIEQKLLATPEFEFVEVPATSYSRYGDYADDYKFNIVLNGERNKIIALRTKQLVNGGRTVYIHVTRIDHGKMLSKMISAPFIYSKSKDRSEQIEKFKNGEINVLISTLLGEGVDIGGIDSIIMAAGGKSEISTIQRVGRALRPKPGKKAIIVDFIDNSRYLKKHTMERYESYIKHYGENCLKRRKKE